MLHFYTQTDCNIIEIRYVHLSLETTLYYTGTFNKIILQSQLLSRDDNNDFSFMSMTCGGAGGRDHCITPKCTITSTIPVLLPIYCNYPIHAIMVIISTLNYIIKNKSNYLKFQNPQLQINNNN